MTGIATELRRSRLVKVATFYGAISWLVIQIADVFFPILRLPGWTMTALVLVAVLGFPLALITAWLLDLSPFGLFGQRKLRGDGKVTVEPVSTSTRFIELGLISLVSVIVGYLYFSGTGESAIRTDLAGTPGLSSSQPADGKKSIAVLPFANFSDDAENEFFALGLSEELLNVLARVEELKVAARTSSFEFKDANVNVRTIANRLGVDYVLEGSVRRNGDQMRVTAQLIKADEDGHVFSRTWDRPFADLFKVQDEIAEAVLQELRVTLLGEQRQVISDRDTEDLLAFEAFTKGQIELRKRTPQAIASAQAHFRHALELDPKFARAHVELANAYSLSISYSGARADEVKPKALDAISQAMELKPDLAEAYAAKGLLLMIVGYQQDGTEQQATLGEAGQMFERSITLNPNYAEAYNWYGNILEETGDTVKGMAYHKKAFELDPVSSIASFNRAEDLIEMGRYDEALSIHKVMVTHNPSYGGTYYVPAAVYHNVGNLNQAYSWYQRAMENENDFARYAMFKLLLDLEAFDEAEKAMAQVADREADPKKAAYLQMDYLIAQGKIEELGNYIRNELPENFDANEKLLFQGMAAANARQWQAAVRDLQTAIAAMEESGKHTGNFWHMLQYLILAQAYQETGDELRAESALNRVENMLTEKQEAGFANAELTFIDSAIKLRRGKTLEAFSLLSEAVGQGWTRSWMLKHSTLFDTIRGDAYFKNLVAKLDARIQLMREKVRSRQALFAAEI